MKTRITELLGIDIPVVQAPMGYIARAQLASAVSNAGGMGIIETSSGQLDEIKVEIAKMRDLTDRPWGVNIAQMLMPDATVIDFVIEHEVRFVTTSAGDPRRFTSLLKEAGVTVFHVVPTLRGASKAVDAGVDGLIVEGVEGGGFKNAHGSSTMVLTPLVRAAVDVPVIAAGGICDGVSMAAALTLGADGSPPPGAKRHAGTPRPQTRPAVPGAQTAHLRTRTHQRHRRHTPRKSQQPTSRLTRTRTQQRHRRHTPALPAQRR